MIFHLESQPWGQFAPLRYWDMSYENLILFPLARDGRRGAEWNGGDEDHHNTWIKVGGTYYVDNQVLSARALRHAF